MYKQSINYIYLTYNIKTFILFNQIALVFDI